MFDTDSRTIKAEIDPCVYILEQVLDGMLAWLPAIRKDDTLFSLYKLMRDRVGQLTPKYNPDEIEEFIVCGFSEQI